MSSFAGFQSVKLNKPQRSHFDLSHDRRTTTRMGRLTPVLITEAIPGDTFRGSSEVLLRLAPLLAPIYDQIELYVHYFFVPNRLLWEDWEEFITGGRLGVGVDPVTAPVPPFFSIDSAMGTNPDSFANSSLAAYLGVPTLLDIDPVVANWSGLTLDIMPFAAYQLVWFEYYRDRNFVTDDFFTIPMPLPSGGIGFAAAQEYLALRTRNYKHDYFTSALPFTQRGEEVLMPLAGTGTPIYRDPARVAAAAGTATQALGVRNGTSNVNRSSDGTFDDPAGDTIIDNIESIVLDSSSVSINDFRSAYALQVWLERNAIGGSRYTESTQAHFGVKPQDSRLQRPEYIGGGRIPVKISEIVSTAWSNDGTAEVPLANMAGHGVTYGNTNNFNYFCTEHGIILGVASIMNPPSYQQGLPRMFKRHSFLDYPWPTFAKLGEQPVWDFELYAAPANLLPSLTGEYLLFGYQSRYADWKYICNSNSGDFRDTLLFWTLTRTFDNTPLLSAEFNEFDDTTQDRIFAVNGGSDNFWMYVHNKLSVRRALPYFGTPNTLGFE